VAVIDRVCPEARAEAESGVGYLFSQGRASHVRAVLVALDALPARFLTVTGDRLVDYQMAVATVRNALDEWAGPRRGIFNLAPVHGLFSWNPLTVIRQTLGACPDEVPAPTTRDLPFIADPDLRATLRQDISAAEQALGNEEWKGATVLAGSVIEALLLWHVQQSPASSVTQAVQAAVAPKALKQAPSKPPEDWHLPDLIEVAAGLGRLKDQTVAACRQAKEFRNLIHPGRVQRLAVRCTRGTAYAALGALHLVAEDLS
jgi:hypothetical protein